MHFYDIHNRYSFLPAIPPVSEAGNTAHSTVILDLQGYFGLELAILLGSLADADATFAVTGVHGNAVDDTSNPTSITDSVAMTDADLLGTLAQASFQYDDDNKVKKVGYKVSTYRYVQFTITPSANASAALIAALFIARPKAYGAQS
jgi:hypothetical protein